jgi:transcription initiation factor TFIIE subunit alpha
VDRQVLLFHNEQIESVTDLRINNIRKVLYDMFGKALITGIRVKDEKKGWFVYRWRAKRDQIDNFIDNQKKKFSIDCMTIKR